MFISVIISTYNRCEVLKAMLSTLAVQECDGSFDYEFIIIDNNSTDQTKQVIEAFTNQQGSRFRYIFEPIQGKSHALNNAVRQAKGDIIAFTDDDVAVDPKWLLSIKQCFEQHECDGLGGCVLPIYPSHTPEWVKKNIDILMGTIVSYDYGSENKKYEKPMYEFIGANYAFRKSMFEECGLFRTDMGVGKSCLGEDTEYVNRLEQRKKKLYYCGKALVWHPVDLKRTSLDYIARWNIALGRYRALNIEYKALPEDLTYYSGIPRYLIREIIQTALVLAFNIFNKREFLKQWIKMSIDRGRAIEFQEIYKGKRTGD
jgi:glycosyltransferase involved in cell wall biosynthesis